MFLYYGNEESDDTINRSTKRYKTESRVSQEILEQ